MPIAGVPRVARIIDLRHNSVVKIAAGIAPADDVRTRDTVARQILENGPSTAAALSTKLGFTPAGIRRHLDALVSDGVLEAREPHAALVRGRGRPSKVFVMTDNGREKFEHSYDDLAVAALKFMSSQMGEESIKAFAESRAEDIIKKASLSIVKKSQKSDALALFLTEQGYAANVVVKAHGEEICQHHCPIAHVAAEFPQLCEAETRAFSEILGTHVQRLATIAHGDGVCTTFVPKTARTLTTKRGRS